MPWQFFRAPAPLTPEFDRPSPVFEAIDLRQELQAMCAIHGPCLSDRGVAVELSLPEDSLTVILMPGKLRELLVHIIDLAASVLHADVRLHVLARVEGRDAVINWRESGDSMSLLARAFDARTGAAAVRARTCQTLVGSLGGRMYTAPSPLGEDGLTLRFRREAWCGQVPEAEQLEADVAGTGDASGPAGSHRRRSGAGEASPGFVAGIAPLARSSVRRSGRSSFRTWPGLRWASCVVLLSAGLVTGCGGGGSGGGGGGGGGASLVGSAGTQQAAIEESPAEQPSKPPPACTLQLEGDSILFGMGAGLSRLPESPAMAIKRLRPAYIVTDRSFPGSTVLGRFPTLSNEPIEARFVVVEFGMNDAGQGLNYREPLRAMLQYVKAHASMPIVTGLSHVRGAPAWRDTYDALAREVAQEEGALFADWGSAEFDDADMADDIHPAQAYSSRLVSRLVEVLDQSAPECR